MSDFAAKVSIIVDCAAPAAQVEAYINALKDCGALEILIAADVPTFYEASFTSTLYPLPTTLTLADRWNEAAKVAKGEFLLFIRPWVGFGASSVGALAEILTRDMSIAACAPALIKPDGTAASQELIVFEDECKRRPIDFILRPVNFTYAPDWPSPPQDGIAYLPDILMVRKVAFWAVGGWETGLESEELGLTLGLALKELNWRIVCERSVQAVTACPASETLKLDIRSRQELVLRWYGRFLPHGHRTADGVIRHHPWIPANTGNLPTLCQGVASPFFPLTSGSAYRQGDIPGEQCSIIVVTYNSMTSIQACVTSVTENMGYFDELILVDNGSRDETPEFLKSLEVTDPRIKVILNGKNLGFAEGCNVGIAQSCGDYIVLLNPDTVATEGWLGRMRAYFLDSTVGAVGPISNGAFGLQGYNFHFPRNVKDSLAPADVHALATQVNARRAIESKLLIGFCLMVPRKILDKVGHLDPELFLGCDDLDLSWRLRLAGYRLLIASDVFVLHRVHVSFQTEPLDVIEPLERSSANAFAKKLQAHYGKGNVPSQEELWGIDWFRPPDVVVWPKAA